MNILQFMLQNWDSVLVVAIAIAVVVVLIARNQYGVLNKIVFALVTEAERKYGGGTGAAKLAAVIEWVYPKIPALIRLFITAAQLEKLINGVLEKAKEKWEKNPNLAAYIATPETKEQ